jgi:hypothetical protein
LKKLLQFSRASIERNSEPKPYENHKFVDILSSLDFARVPH